MHSMTSFSVILPVYNAAPWLRACLDSVLAAAGRLACEVEGKGEGGHCGEGSPVEVICVDDGSTDGSDRVLAEYAIRQSDSQTIDKQAVFKLVHQPNAGVGAARNAGLKVATGDYVCFLDPDDVIAPGWFANFAKAIGESAADLVMSGYRTFFDGEVAQLDARGTGEIVERGEGEGVRQRLVRHFLVDGRCFVFAVRRELLQDVRFVEGIRLAEDMLFCVKMSSKIRSFVRTDYLGHGYRQHVQSLTAVGLRSRERVAFLRAFAELRRETEGVDASLAAWQMVQFWLVNAADVDAAAEIRDELRHLREIGMFRLGDLPRLSRPGAALFMRWPKRTKLVRFVHCAVYKVGKWLV